MKPYQCQYETVHSPKNCLPGSGSQSMKLDRIRIPVVASDPNEVSWVVFQRGIEKQIISTGIRAEVAYCERGLGQDLPRFGRHSPTNAKTVL